MDRGSRTHAAIPPNRRGKTKLATSRTAKKPGANRSHEAVHRAHGLAPHEKLLGWLYVGGRTERDEKPRKLLEPGRFVSAPGSATAET